jgi:hypothetical protein
MDRDAARRNTRMRFEQWVKNPACEANTVSAVHNVRMADVARAIGLRPSFGQSPFAIARGREFERQLLAKDGERLHKELIRAAVLPPDASGFLDIRLRMNGGPRVVTLDQALAETRSFLGDVAEGRSVPSLVAGATVRIPRGVMLPEAILIIDALAIRTDLRPATIVVGEIKSYPDRAGYTDPAELAAARAQAGLYVHALDLVVDSIGEASRIDVSREGFLVLTKPGSNWPSIRAGEDLRYQAVRAERGFQLLEDAAQVLPEQVAVDDEPVDDQLMRAVIEGEHRYSEACLSFCDLAPNCHEEARDRGDAVVLGEDLRRFVGGIPLDRVTSLMNGATPADETEADLIGRLRVARGAVVG